MQKDDGSFQTYFHINCAALNSIQGKLRSNITKSLPFEEVYSENDVKKGGWLTSEFNRTAAHKHKSILYRQNAYFQQAPLPCWA